jgi:hypothetical protein
MKFETIAVVAEGEIHKLLAKQAEKNGTESKAAKIYGISQPEFHRTRIGYSQPPAKLLNALGLEMRRVIVRKIE